MTRDRKYQLRVHSSDLARWNEAARAVGLQTAVWVRTRLNDASILELENPSAAVEIEVEICPSCGGTRMQHELMGGCPVFVLGGTERAVAAAPPAEPTPDAHDVTREEYRYEWAGEPGGPLEPVSEDAKLLDEMEKNMSPSPAEKRAAALEMFYGKTERKDGEEPPSLLDIVKTNIPKRVDIDDSEHTTRRPVLAKNCTNGELHWRLRRGEACRWCGGIA
jgi:hypothetical protein